MADVEMNLKDTFDKGFNLYRKIESDERPSSSEQFQNDVSQAISFLKRTVEMVSELAIFSTNEELEEISTNDLRYLLLPALLGDLYLKSCTCERIDVVKTSEVYLLDFLERCKIYGLFSQNIHLLQPTSGEPNIGNRKSLEFLACERQAKITRYKKLKEQEKQIKDLAKVLEDCSQLSHDEELLRKYNILLLENWINKALDHISSIKNELPILEHMEKNKQQGQNTSEDKTTNNDKLDKKQHLAKPILITREAIQNKVFGAGYPSLPTMTQEEYFAKELREGKIVTEFREQKNTGDKNEEDTQAESSDDEKYLSKLKKDREWDDWKDDHRRGWGNRENMG